HATHAPSRCGDGVLDAAEECDDGNQTSCDGCSSSASGVPGCLLEDGLATQLGYVPCNNGDSCTIEDYCDDTSCRPGIPRDCGYLDDACGVGVCNQDSNACVKVPRSAPGSCDDYNPCTLGDRCTSGECRGTPAPVSTICTDDDPCTSVDGEVGHPDRCDGFGRCHRLT